MASLWWGPRIRPRVTEDATTNSDSASELGLSPVQVNDRRSAELHSRLVTSEELHPRYGLPRWLPRSAIVSGSSTPKHRVGRRRLHRRGRHIQSRLDARSSRNQVCLVPDAHIEARDLVLEEKRRWRRARRWSGRHALNLPFNLQLTSTTSVERGLRKLRVADRHRRTSCQVFRLLGASVSGGLVIHDVAPFRSLPAC